MDSALVPYSGASEQRDYYAILGVGRYATIDAINYAYNMYAEMCRPGSESYDASKMPIGNLTQEEYWHLVNEAYEVLSVPEFRVAYDNYGELGLKTYPLSPYNYRYRFSGNCQRIYESFQALHRTVQSQPEGAGVPPCNVHVLVTLEELFFGLIKTVHYYRKITVDGYTTVVTETVPLYIIAGTVNGTRILKRGLGDSINNVVGDVWFIVTQLPHPVFRVHGPNLCIRVQVTLKAALTGGAYTVLCIDGKTLTMYLNRLNFPVKLRGEGMPIPNTSERGDMVVHHDVRMPTYVPEHIKSDLRRLLDMCY